jgi:hypothetical protein
MTMIPRSTPATASPQTIPLTIKKTIEEAKKRSLEGENKPSETIESAPGWNESLASESEAHLKADKEDLSGVTVEELQTKTIKQVKEKHHRGST